MLMYEQLRASRLHPGGQLRTVILLAHCHSFAGSTTFADPGGGRDATSSGPNFPAVDLLPSSAKWGPKSDAREPRRERRDPPRWWALETPLEVANPVRRVYHQLET